MPARPVVPSKPVVVLILSVLFGTAAVCVLMCGTQKDERPAAVQVTSNYGLVMYGVDSGKPTKQQDGHGSLMGDWGMLLAGACCIAVLVFTVVVSIPKSAYACWFFFRAWRNSSPEVLRGPSNGDGQSQSDYVDLYLGRMEALERIIESDTGSVSVAVVGPWGSGKSRMLRELMRHYEQEKPDAKIVPIHYDVWRHQSSGTPEWCLLQRVFDSRLMMEMCWWERPYWTFVWSGALQFLYSGRVTVSLGGFGVKPQAPSATDAEGDGRGKSGGRNGPPADTFVFHKVIDRVMRRLARDGYRPLFLMDEMDRCNSRTTQAAVTLIARCLKSHGARTVTAFVPEQFRHKVIKSASQPDLCAMFEAESADGRTDSRDQEVFEKFFDTWVFLERPLPVGVGEIFKQSIRAAVPKVGRPVSDDLQAYLCQDQRIAGRPRVLHGLAMSVFVEIEALRREAEKQPADVEPWRTLRKWDNLSEREIQTAIHAITCGFSFTRLMELSPKVGAEYLKELRKVV